MTTDVPGVVNERRRWFLMGLGAATLVGCILAAAVGTVLWFRDSNDELAELNISCFAFRDVNRNGIYDLEDRPYAGLMVEMTGPSDDASTLSNISGFANFPMSLNNDDRPVNRAGTYAFRPIAPDGHSFTVAGVPQTLTFTELPGSPAGLTADPTCAPIGVAADLRIIGSVGRGVDASSSAISVSSNGPDLPIDAFEGEYFFTTAEPGTWTVSVDGTDMSSRTVEVDDHPVYVSAPNDDRDSFDALSDDVTIDFEGFTESDTLYEMPNGAGGLNWRNWIATHHKLYEGAGYINATTSSEYIGYNSSGHPAVVSSDEPFDFVGTHLGVAWPDGELFDIVIQGFRGDEVVYEDRVRASTEGALYIDADYRSITRMEISSEGSWQFVADDMHFRLP